LPPIDDIFSPPIDYNVVVAENTHSPAREICTYLKMFFLGVVCFAFIFFTIDSVTSNYTRTLVDDFFTKISQYNGFLVFLCYFLTDTLALIIAFPCTLLNLYGGLLFGKEYGFSLGVFVSILAIQFSTLFAQYIIFKLAKFGFNEEIKMIEQRYKLLWAMRLALRKRGLKVIFITVYNKLSKSVFAD